MPFTVSMFDDPTAGVEEVLVCTVLELRAAGVPVAAVLGFGLEVVSPDEDEAFFQASRRARGHSDLVVYSRCSLHDYSTAEFSLTPTQVLGCRIAAACRAWLAAPDDHRKTIAIYLESLIFERDTRPVIEAAGVSKAQRARAKAPRKDAAGIVDPAGVARNQIGRAKRRNADRGDALKAIARDTGFTVRHLSTIATEMGWPGKKGRPTKPKNRTAG